MTGVRRKNYFLLLNESVQEKKGGPHNRQSIGSLYVCKICERQFRNLLIHLQKSKTCQIHYNMDYLQEQARKKQKAKHSEAQAAYRQRQLQQDPIS